MQLAEETRELLCLALVITENSARSCACSEGCPAEMRSEAGGSPAFSLFNRFRFAATEHKKPKGF